MREQWVLYRKSSTTPMKLILFFTIMILIGNILFKTYTENMNSFIFGYTLVLAFINKPDALHLRSILPLSKNKRFGFDVLISFVTMVLLAIIYLIYFMIIEASAIAYFNHLILISVLFFLIAIENTLPKSFKRNESRISFIVLICIIVLVTTFNISELVTNQFQYIFGIGVPITMIILFINYHYYDRLGHRNLLKNMPK